MCHARLTNVNTGHRRCGSGIACGGHLWSSDGRNWSDTFIGAFGPHGRMKNGSNFSLGYVERPQIAQVAPGEPLLAYSSPRVRSICLAPPSRGHRSSAIRESFRFISLPSRLLVGSFSGNRIFWIIKDLQPALGQGKYKKWF